MSSEAIAVVEAFIDAWNRGADAGALATWFAPGFEWDMSRSLGFGRGVHGIDRWPQLFDDIAGDWDSVSYELTDITGAGDRVVTAFHNRMRGRDGIEVSARGALLWTVRDGLIARVCLYQELEEARAAAGLE